MLEYVMPSSSSFAQNAPCILVSNEAVCRAQKLFDYNIKHLQIVMHDLSEINWKKSIYVWFYALYSVLAKMYTNWFNLHLLNNKIVESFSL